MMPIDERAAATKALELAAHELYDRAYAIAMTYPDVFRRGAEAMFEQPQTGAQRTQARQTLQLTGQRDPGELDSLLEQMVKDTSLEEVLDLLGSGRAPG